MFGKNLTSEKKTFSRKKKNKKKGRKGRKKRNYNRPGTEKIRSQHMFQAAN
jgi:isopenicillin N synthase-like dioxygenase